MEKLQAIQQRAEELFNREGIDWTTFFREVLGVNGIVHRMYPTHEAMLEFEKTTQFQELQRMLSRLREKLAVSSVDEPTKVITVRLPTGPRFSGRSHVPFTIQSEAPPIREDAEGTLRVGSSNVLLELVIRAFQDGATPETIKQRYPTLELTDVYAVVAYYLRHCAEVDAYLDGREQKAGEVQHRIEAQQTDLSEIRARLSAHQSS
jgi:uncharacterized protein (DUF433 family)